MCDEESRVFETSDITDKEYPEEARIQFSIKMGTPFFQTGTTPHEFTEAVSIIFMQFIGFISGFYGTMGL